MDKFPKNVKDILHSEPFKKYLKSGDISSLYDFISVNIDRDTLIPIITNIFYRSGVNLLENQDEIPSKFFAYNDYDYVKNFIVPDGIENIRYKAFAYSAVENIKFSNSLLYIGVRAFEYCYGLSAIKFPKTRLKIDDYAFKDCNNLNRIVISENTVFIHPRSFPGKVIKFEGTTEKFESICPLNLTSNLESTFTNVKCKDGVLVPVQDGRGFKFEKH